MIHVFIRFLIEVMWYSWLLFENSANYYTSRAVVSLYLKVKYGENAVEDLKLVSYHEIEQINEIISFKHVMIVLKLWDINEIVW